MKIKRINKIHEQVQMIGTGFSDSPIGIMINLENSYNTQNIGYFNSKQIVNKIANQAGTNATLLTENIHFQYNKRLDASISDDSINGFGSINGGIIDTGVSGALSENKLIRIIHDGKNIKDVTGLNLKVYAKNLNNLNSSYITSPPSDQLWIDPLNGKYILPYPIFWHTCDNNTPNIYNSNYPLTINYEQLSGFDTYGYGSVGSKFSKSLYLQTCYGGFVEGGARALSRYIPINKEMDWNKGSMSLWSYNALQFPQGNSQAMNDLYCIFAPGCYIRRSHYNTFNILQFFINDSEVARVNIQQGTVHIYIVWDRNGLSDGSTVKVFINGVLTFNYNGSFNNASSHKLNIALVTLMVVNYGISTISIENVKLWNHPIENPDFEYNSGNGNKEILHRIYGSTLKPTNLQVGYVYLNITDASSIVMLKPGNNEQIALESAKNIDNGIFTVQNGSLTLRKTDYSLLTNNTDFQYDKRLDASITEDTTDGFGVIDGGIIDTGISGSLASNKYLRIVENGKNIKDVTGLNLKVYAKNLSNLVINPPKDKIYIDPILGKVILPRPVFWNKCRTWSGMNTPTIGASEWSMSESSGTYTLNEASVYSTISAKWGNMIYAYIGGANVTGTCIGRLKINNTNYSKGSLSIWYWVICDYGNGDSCHIIYISNTTYVVLGKAGLDGVYYFRIVVNGVEKVNTTVAYDRLWHHAYITWDTNIGITLWFDGVSLLNCAESFSIANDHIFQIRFEAHDLESNGTAWMGFNEIKMWDDYYNDPSATYNGGAGNEEAMHPIFTGTGRKPLLITPNGGVGYNKIGGSGTLTRLRIK